MTSKLRKSIGAGTAPMKTPKEENSTKPDLGSSFIDYDRNRVGKFKTNIALPALRQISATRYVPQSRQLHTPFTQTPSGTTFDMRSTIVSVQF